MIQPSPIIATQSSVHLLPSSGSFSYFPLALSQLCLRVTDSSIW